MKMLHHVWRRVPKPIREGTRFAAAQTLRAAFGGTRTLDIDGRKVKFAFSTPSHFLQIGRIGTREKEFYETFKQLSREARVIFDIGANIGLYSIAGRCCNQTAEIHAFEPEGTNGRQITYTAALNWFEGICLHSICLGDTDGPVDLQIKGSCSHSIATNGMNGNRIRTVMRRLDTLLHQQSVPMPDLVKIDVEGYELRVLKGMTHVLRQGTATMLVEVHSYHMSQYGDSPADLDQFMDSFGYSKEVLRQPRNDLRVQHQQVHVVYRPSAKQ